MLSLSMSTFRGKADIHSSLVMSANDPKQTFSCAYSRSRRLVSLKCLPQSRAGDAPASAATSWLVPPQGRLAGNQTYRTSGCPIRHTMPRPL